jgi:RHS repeat-associated protein
LSNTLDGLFCVEALEEALALHDHPEIFNSDQGVQFTSSAFTGVPGNAGIAISMDGRGRALDNVFVERLQGKRLDTTTLNYNFNAREVRPSLMRLDGPDPSGTVDGSNLYQFVTSNPVGLVDPMGLETTMNLSPRFFMPPTETQDGRPAQGPSSDEHCPPIDVPVPPERPKYVIVEKTPLEKQIDEYRLRKFLEIDKGAEVMHKIRQDVRKQAPPNLIIWLGDHPKATYGPFPPNQQVISDGRARRPAGTKGRTYHIKCPTSQIIYNGIQRVIIGKGGPGDRGSSQEAVGEGMPEGTPPATRFRDKYTMKGGPRGDIYDGGTNSSADKQADAGVAAANAAAAFLDEVSNGVNECDVIVWEDGSNTGFYVVGQNERQGRWIIAEWLGWVW